MRTFLRRDGAVNIYCMMRRSMKWLLLVHQVRVLQIPGIMKFLRKVNFKVNVYCYKFRIKANKKYISD